MVADKKNSVKHNAARIRVFPEDKLKKTLGLLLCAIAFIIYCNTLKHDYVLDDYSLIVENTVTVKGIKAIPEIFSNFYRYGYSSKNDGIYRPLSVAMFAVEWALSPNNPKLSHLINVLFYVLTAWVVFITLCRLLKNYSVTFPFIITLLFVTHPLHTEVVANIKSRDELVCFLFSFITLYYLLDYVEFNSLKKLGLALVFFFGAFLSKETAITMVMILPLMLFFFTDAKGRTLLFSTLGLSLVAIVFLTIRFNVLNAAKSYEVTALENSLLLAPNQLDQLATEIKILGHYLALNIYPNVLLCDRSFNHIPIVSLTDPGVVISLITYAAMIIFCIWRFLKKDVLVFGIFFYLITLSLFSNIIFKIGVAMADRFVYFASFGFCFAVATILVRVIPSPDNSVLFLNLRDFFDKNRSILSIVIVIGFLYSIKTINRNNNWKDNYTLFKHDLKYAPNNARAHSFLGTEIVKTVAAQETDPTIRMALYNQGIEELKLSLRIYPDDADALNCIAAGYFQMNSLDSAEHYFKKASTYDSTNFNRLADFYMGKNDYVVAIETFKKTLAHSPKNLDACVNLGICYGTLKDYKASIIYFTRALLIEPENARILYFLATAYKFNGDSLNSETYYQKALLLDPTTARP